MSGWHYMREPGDAGQILAADGTAPGHGLDVLLERARPPLRAALGIASALADILCIALEDRMVHGDIRPSHVRVDEQGRVSVDGWGVARRATRAPEGRTDLPAVDLYGLGVVLHSMLSVEPLGQLPRDGEAHDDEVVERVLAMDFREVEGRRWVEEVRSFLCKILAWHPEDRPLPLDAANVLASVATQCPGEDLTSWAHRAITGRPLRMQTQAAAPAPAAPPSAPAPRPVSMPAPFGGDSRGVRQAPAARGESTAAWTRERIAAMLAEEDDEDTRSPAGRPAAATSSAPPPTVPARNPMAPPAYAAPAPFPPQTAPAPFGAPPPAAPFAAPAPFAPPPPAAPPARAPMAAPPAPFGAPPPQATPSPFGAPPPSTAPSRAPMAAPPAPFGAPPPMAAPAPFAAPPAAPAPAPFAAPPMTPPSPFGAPPAAPAPFAPPPFAVPTGPTQPARGAPHAPPNDAYPSAEAAPSARSKLPLILGGGVVVLLGLAGVIALALRGGGESPAPAPTSAPAPEATMPRVADDEAARAAAMLAGEAPPEPAQPEPAQPEPAPEPVKAPPSAPTPEPVAPRTAPAKAPPPTKAPPKPAEAPKPPPAPKTPAPTKSTTKSSAAPAPASAPAASGGSFSVRFSVPGREARVQCGDGQAADFSGATSMTFATTTTCLVKVDHGRGAVQVSQTGTVTCAEDAGKVSCSGN